MNTPKEEKNCDCKSRYCEHYESDFDRFLKENPIELAYCKTCIQMTNHRGTTCLKCEHIVHTDKMVEEKGWEEDDSPYRIALAHAMTFALIALNEKKSDISDELIQARESVDGAVRKIISQAEATARRDILEKITRILSHNGVATPFIGATIMNRYQLLAILESEIDYPLITKENNN
jgi:hypothetical protein